MLTAATANKSELTCNLEIICHPCSTSYFKNFKLPQTPWNGQWVTGSKMILSEVIEWHSPQAEPRLQIALVWPNSIVVLFVCLFWGQGKLLVVGIKTSGNFIQIFGLLSFMIRFGNTGLLFPHFSDWLDLRIRFPLKTHKLTIAVDLTHLTSCWHTWPE